MRTENANDENETQASTIDAMLDSIRRANLAQSRAHFDNLMNDKVFAALDAEKVNIASSVYQTEEEPEVELEAEEEEVEETEISDEELEDLENFEDEDKTEV